MNASVLSSSSAKQQPKEEEDLSAQTASTMWDSIESPEVQKHPLLQVVLCLVKQNLDNCLSSSHSDVDTKDSTDDKKSYSRHPVNLSSTMCVQKFDPAHVAASELS